MQFYDVIRRLKNFEPIQYIFNQTFFYNSYFKLNKNVLIPRPETEELVDWVINSSKEEEKIKILDIGTGSGCIAISLKKKLKLSQVIAIDNSKEAIDIAKENALKNNTIVDFKLIDIFKFSINFETVDCIVSNPPYIIEKEKVMMSKNVLNYEPKNSLFVKGKDPIIFYKQILKLSKQILNPLGKIYFELNDSTSMEVYQYIKQLNEFDEIEIKQDLQGKKRMLKAIKK